jgi:hypothetical protein
MTDDIMTRLLDFRLLKDTDLAKLLLDAANEIEWLHEIVEGLLAGCSHHADGDLPFGECEWHTAYMAYRSKYPAQMNEYQKMWAEKLKESNNE